MASQEYDKRANYIETDTLCISTLARQEFLHELTQFAKFKQNQAPSPSQSTAVASFVFLAKMKQFCKHFLKFCTQNIISEVNNNATINENEKVDLGKANFWNSMDEYVLLTNQEEHLQSLDAAKLLQFELKQIEILYAKVAKSSQKLMSVFSELMFNDFFKANLWAAS